MGNGVNLPATVASKVFTGDPAKNATPGGASHGKPLKTYTTFWEHFFRKPHKQLKEKPSEPNLHAKPSIHMSIEQKT